MSIRDGLFPYVMRISWGMAATIFALILSAITMTEIYKDRPYTLAGLAFALPLWVVLAVTADQLDPGETNEGCTRKAGAIFLISFFTLLCVSIILIAVLFTAFNKWLGAMFFLGCVTASVLGNLMVQANLEED